METRVEMDYLKEVLDLEKQNYIYKQIRKFYEKYMEESEASKNELRLCEEYRGDSFEGKTDKVLVKPGEIEEDRKDYYDVLYEAVTVMNNKELLVKLLVWRYNSRIYAIGIGEGKRVKRNNPLYGAILTEYTTWYNTELENKRQYISAKIEALKSGEYKRVVENIESISQSLEQIYAKNILLQKYQYFIPVAQMYEYFNEGRCSKLEGEDGAYSLFESELGAKVIVDKTDEIMSKLDEFERNMSIVVSALRETNEIIEAISNKLKQNSVEDNN